MASEKEPQREGDSSAADDDRATERPARDDTPGQDPVDSPGPYGNPELDEESLRHQQEEEAEG
jgi:hypothetical protein